jgi:hypothetical protein
MAPFKTEPHAEHTVELTEDNSEVGYRLYQISNNQGAIGFTGEELESLFRWWQGERLRGGVDAED